MPLFSLTKELAIFPSSKSRSQERHNDFRTSVVDCRLYLQRLLVEKPRYAFTTYSFTPFDASLGLTGILMLNICLLMPLLTSVVNGIDSSLLNGLSLSRSNSTYVLSTRITGLQLLPDWQNYFGHPRGRTLGKQS